MKPAIERRLLQIAVAIACLVPLNAGLRGVLEGAHFVKVTAPAADLDSHFRYMSGIFLMMGVGFVTTIPAIERKGARFRMLAAMVIVGGMARALSWVEVGAPGFGHRFGLVMELGVVPLLVLCQWRVEKRSI
ncbi:DUF4345 domain-containing protein [Sphingomonas montanisoli]|uniref:DUF4345 domain-containing protein n=1 Tax=Sphingomonas montanisoli TaxID=2606412 RepID=A0A5D9CCJ4_9SPHN|nr:DUF4345 domain-containing protein [Sphingomonas montanisoli]TZG29057.1 DUF4345 domain-containing protein [Sphingomonas montanisoli]